MSNPGPGSQSLKEQVLPQQLDLSPSKIELTSSGNLAAIGPTAYYPVQAGGNADIYKAIMTSGGVTKAVAIKIYREAHVRVDHDKEVYANRLRKEYGIWGALRHRNILHLEGLTALHQLPSAGLVFEFKEHGDLQRFMTVQARGTYDPLCMAKEISLGLEYLHSQGVVHGNLTPRNILIGLDKETGSFFPLIKESQGSRISFTNCTNVGRTHHVASPPELLECSMDDDGRYRDVLTPPSDVYSFSLVLLELITGRVPYSQEHRSFASLIALIVDFDPPLRPTPEKYPVLDRAYDFCWPIMTACWEGSKEKRITSNDVRLLLHKDSRSPPSLENSQGNAGQGIDDEGLALCIPKEWGKARRSLLRHEIGERNC